MYSSGPRPNWAMQMRKRHHFVVLSRKNEQSDGFKQVLFTLKENAVEPTSGTVRFPVFQCFNVLIINLNHSLGIHKLCNRFSFVCLLMLAVVVFCVVCCRGLPWGGPCRKHRSHHTRSAHVQQPFGPRQYCPKGTLRVHTCFKWIIFFYFWINRYNDERAEN